LVARSYKSDGTVVTQIDRWVEEYLVAQIACFYPGANVLGEESAHLFDPSKPYTFAVDPIDGTEVYSLGLEGWCVSVGLLDQALSPIAGILFAPRLGSFLLM
jgi:myo-inositol-1(or 4)-monophosphatase